MLQELLSAITEYANGGRSEALREWLVDNVQAVLDERDEAAIALVNEFEAMFARLSEGLVTERELFDHATAIARAQVEIRPLVKQETVITSSDRLSHVASTQGDLLVRVA